MKGHNETLTLTHLATKLLLKLLK